jgi:hypothetical protein
MAYQVTYYSEVVDVWMCLCLYVCIVCVCMKMVVFWDVVPCSLVDIDQCFRGSDPGIGGIKLL